MPSLQYFDKLISNVIVFYIDSIENFLSDNNDKKISSSFFVQKKIVGIYIPTIITSIIAIP